MKWAWNIFILAFLFMSCTKEKKEIQFYYTRNYAGDNWSNHKTGLLWTLSYLGATLPKGSFDSAIHWKDSANFAFDFSKVGFTDNALAAIKVICDSLMSTSQYQNKKAADIGAFTALTIGCSNHYYKITGVPSTTKELLRLKKDDSLKQFAVTRSAVAKHHRVIRYSRPSADPLKWIFIADEGDGNLNDNTFKPEFFEIFDIMENGQLRFMVYDQKGNLVPASPKKLGEAGKPAKCLWCHEIVIQPLFEKTDSCSGSISKAEFQADVIQFMSALKSYRSKLESDVDFNRTQDHTQMELEYITYMQPSVKKLAMEWNMSEKEVSELVKTVTQHQHEEFKFLGNVFHRKDVIRFKTLFPEHIREPNQNEINFFK